MDTTPSGQASCPKRHKSRGEQPGHYTYPDVPTDAINPDTSREFMMRQKGVPRTSSDDWGSGAIAKARALLEPATEENLSLLRTHHPALASATTAMIMEEQDGRQFWQIQSPTPVCHTHAGGLAIHLMPRDYLFLRGRLTVDSIPLTQRSIHPRRLLSAADLDDIRRVYRHAIGVQLLFVGHLVILFASIDDFKKDIWGMKAATYYPCNLPVFYRVPAIKPTTTTTASVGSALDSSGGTCALGLRLKLPTGESVITTVTHGLVYRDGLGRNILTRTSSLISNWAWKVSRRLFYGQPTPRLPLVLEDTRMIDNFNLPLGKKVQLFKDRSIIGTITSTFDTPHVLLPYPAGYSHDLSLISNDDQDQSLLTIVPPPGSPPITGWANLVEVLDGAPVFIAAYLMGLNTSGWGAHCGSVMQNPISAAVEGTQFLWDSDSGQQSVSLLWRVVDQPVGDARGYSGAVLCSGHPSAAEAKAVVFQNFSDPTAHFPDGNGGHILGLHGGFVLPSLIYASSIECGPAIKGHNSQDTFYRNAIATPRAATL